MKSKQEAADILCVTQSKLRRLCKQYRADLEKMGYKTNSHFMKDACVDFLKTKIIRINVYPAIERVSKNDIAKRLGLSTRTLAKLINNNDIFKKLQVFAYNPRQKKLTEEQANIIYEELE